MHFIVIYLGSRSLLYCCVELSKGSKIYMETNLKNLNLRDLELFFENIGEKKTTVGAVG